MRIAYLCADPGIPLYGRKGCSTHVRETARILMSLGHSVRIWCTNVGGDETDGPPLDVVHVRPVQSKKLGFDLRHILTDQRLWRRIRGDFAQWRPDVIYERYSLYARTGTRATAEFGLPRLLEVNAFLTKEQHQRIRLAWLARRVEGDIIRRAPRVIVVSEPLRREVHELGQSMAAIAKMPMAVNLDKFHPDGPGREELRRRHGLHDRFVIGYVGTLAGWHGIRLLYDVARRLRKRATTGYAFLIVGGDGLKLEMHRRKAREAGLEDVLRFVGSVPHDDVPAHIRAMDAAIVPDTTYWSSPAKLFEYQACGVPVLAPAYPAILESLEDGREGLIYPAGNVKQIAKAVLRLMADPALARTMGDAARRRAELEHSWLHNGEQILTLYHELGARVT